MKTLEKKDIKFLNIGILIFIVFISVLFRTLCLNKPDGLWYDETVSYQEAIKPGIQAITAYTLQTDVHLPFYPILLHYWGLIFSFSDIALRAFSVFFGTLTVLIGFFVGKSYNDFKNGLIFSGFLAINSFLIYYSQEVRQYSLLAFVATFFLLSNIFLIKKKNKESLLLLILSSILLLSANMISFIFVYAQFFVNYIYFKFFQKESDVDKFFLTNLLKTIAIITVINIPNFLNLILNWGHYSSEINGYFFDYSSIFVIIQSWFSPVLCGLTNNPQNYFADFHFNLQSLIFIFLPIIIMFYGIFKAIKNDKLNWIFLSSALLYLLVELIAVKVTNFKILSRYTIVAFVNIIFVSANGFGISKTKISKVLATIFFCLSTFYLIYMPMSAFKLERGGYRPLGQILNSININNNDILLVWNRKKVLNKYVKTDKINILSLLKNFAYSSEILLANEKILNTIPIEQRKNYLRDYFKSDKVPQNTIYLVDIIYKRLKPNQRFIITTSKNFDNYTQTDLSTIANNDSQFAKISYNDLLTIKALIDVKRVCNKEFKSMKKIINKNFVVIIYTK